MPGPPLGKPGNPPGPPVGAGPPVGKPPLGKPGKPPGPPVGAAVNVSYYAYKVSSWRRTYESRRLGSLGSHLLVLDRQLPDVRHRYVCSHGLGMAHGSRH